MTPAAVQGLGSDRGIGVDAALHMRTVYILDDHRLFSNGLELMLATAAMDLDCHVFDDPARALTTMALPASAPSLLIVDFYIPGANVPDIIRQVRGMCPECRIMVVSASINPVDKRQALEAGAAMFVTKASEPMELLDAVRSVLDGGEFAEPAQVPVSLSSRFNLTPRQLDILVFVSKGCTNKEIARLLELSPETVKKHLRDIFQRFGVANRVEAIDFARSNGLA